ncbi:MAG: Lin0512 family protein [Chloroflexota bacterium]
MEDQKIYRRFVVEFGMGLDQHGQNPTKAACKAVKDAVANICLAGVIDIARLGDVNDMRVEMHVACPHPELLDREQVLAALPFGTKELFVEEGGMIAHGLFQPELGDTTDEAFIANAAIIVWVDVKHMLQTWQAELAR